MNQKFCFFMILAVLLYVNPIFSQTENTLSIMGNDVRIRSQASSKAEVLFKVNSFETGSIISKGSKEKIGEFNDHWYQIAIKNKNGWVYGAFTSMALPVNGELKSAKAKMLEAFFGEDGGGYSMKPDNGDTIFFALCPPCDFKRIANEETYFETIDPAVIGKYFNITYRTERHWYEPAATWQIFNVIQSISEVKK